MGTIIAQISMPLRSLTAYYRSSLIWVTLFAIEASETFQQTRKADDFCCDWRFKGQ